MEAPAGQRAVLVPGGSSGGSAAAVAARLALGRDRRPTPAARSASPRASAASSAIKPTYGRCSPLGRRRLRLLARPGRARSRARWRIARSCSARWPGFDPKDSTSRRPPGAGFRRRVPARREGAAHRRAARIPHATAWPPEIEALWQQGLAWLREAGRRDRRRLAAAHEIRPRDLLHRGPGRGVVQPRAL